MTIKFSSVLKKVREEQNVSIGTMKNLVCVSSKEYTMYEDGTKFPTIFTLSKFAKFLNVSPCYLLTGENNLDEKDLYQLPLKSTDSFGLWFYKWVDYKKDEVTYKQIMSYHTSSQHFLPAFCNLGLDDVLWEDINRLFRDNLNYKKETIRKWKNTMKQVFEYAIDCKKFNYNPVINVKVPKSAKESTPTIPISSDTLKMILEFTHKMQPAALIMLLAGLRRGELLALTYGDIHLKEGYISVRKVVEYEGEIPLIRNRAKTVSGIRNVEIPLTLIHFFIEYLGCHREITNESYVISDEEGNVLTNRKFNRLWHEYLSELNKCYGGFTELELNSDEVPIRIEQFTTRNLRTTYSTLLYENGVDPVTIKDQMGHKKIDTTLEIYTKPSKTFKHKSICINLDEYLKEIEMSL